MDWADMSFDGVHTWMCMVEVVYRKQYIVVIFRSILAGHIKAPLAMHSF